MGKVWKLRDAGHFKCKICHKDHDPKSRSFIMIAGNIMVGVDGGLVGHNFEGKPTQPDMNPVLKKVTVVCFECWDKFNEECIRACIKLAQRGVHMPPDCPICEEQRKHPIRKLNIDMCITEVEGGSGLLNVEEAESFFKAPRKEE